MRFALGLVVLALAGCSGSSHDASPEPSRPRAHARAAPIDHASAAVADVAPLPPSTFPAPERLVAIGDVHGDLDAFQAALRAAGAIDGDAHWSGGELFVVQAGDLLDRGEQEREILDLVDRLEDEAIAAGGRLLALDGNHELMNTQGDFRYVRPGGYAEFDSFAHDATGPDYEGIPARVRGRVAAFRPGGPYARMLGTHLTIVLVGDTLVVHGGVRAQYLAGERPLETINEAARAFFLGRSPLASMLEAEDGPVWYRGFALADDEATCGELGAALEAVHARRMVIGHTVQEQGITSACDARVFRIDVGLARIYGGPIQVLEIAGGATRVVSGTR